MPTSILRAKKWVKYTLEMADADIALQQQLSCSTTAVAVVVDFRGVLNRIYLRRPRFGMAEADTLLTTR